MVVRYRSIMLDVLITDFFKYSWMRRSILISVFNTWPKRWFYHSCYTDIIERWTGHIKFLKLSSPKLSAKSHETGSIMTPLEGLPLPKITAVLTWGFLEISLSVKYMYWYQWQEICGEWGRTDQLERDWSKEKMKCSFLRIGLINKKLPFLLYYA